MESNRNEKGIILADNFRLQVIRTFCPNGTFVEAQNI